MYAYAVATRRTFNPSQSAFVTDGQLDASVMRLPLNLAQKRQPRRLVHHTAICPIRIRHDHVFRAQLCEELVYELERRKVVDREWSLQIQNQG
jgi:hypothetical protein